MRNRYDNFRLLQFMKFRAITAIVGGLAMLATRPSITQACAVCVTGTNDPVTDAFNWSVLFLMATPYLVVGSIAGWLFYNYRRAAKKREQTTAEPLVHLSWNQKESGR